MMSSGMSRKQGSGEAHALRQLAKEPHVGARFAGRLDGLPGKLHEVMAVRALNVSVLKERGRWQNVVGVVGCVGKKQLVDHGEKVRPRQPSTDGVLVGGNSAGIRVVDEERVHGRPVGLFPRSLVPLFPVSSKLG
jgi:hypothetical protein